MVSLCTLPPEVLAQPLNPQTTSLSGDLALGGRDLSLSFVPLGIPPELASIEEVFIPDTKDGRRTPLIHIQSVHAHPETQKKIYGVLKFLEKKYGVDSLFIEGAAEMLNPNYFRFFDENRLNVRVAEKLVEKGELTGAELFLIESEKEIPAYGIEEASLYRDNLTAFQTVMLHRPMTTRFMQKTGDYLDRLETRLLQPEARRLLRSNESFDAGQMELLSYVLEIERKTKQILGLDLRHFESQFDWPQLIRLLRLQEVESVLDPERIQTDRQNLTAYLRDAKVDPDLIQSFEQMSFSPYQSGMVYDPGFRRSDLPRYLAELLFLAAAEKGFSFNQYPAFTRYLEAAILKSELEAGRLFDELEKLFEALVRAVSKKDEAWALVELNQKDRLIGRLFDLGLTPKDYAKIQIENQTPRPLVRFLMNIESLHEKAALNGMKLVPDDIDSLETVYTEAVNFYELAKRREERMVDKILAVIARSAEGATKQSTSSQIASASSGSLTRNDGRSPVTVLITGGFHTEGLSRAFRKNQVPYTILSPRITEKVSTEAYVSMLLGEKKTAFDVQYLESDLDTQGLEILYNRMWPLDRRDAMYHSEVRVVTEGFLNVANENSIDYVKAAGLYNRSPYAQNRRAELRIVPERNTLQPFVNEQPLRTKNGLAFEIPTTTQTKVQEFIVAVPGARILPNNEVQEREEGKKGVSGARAEVRATEERQIINREITKSKNGIKLVPEQTYIWNEKRGTGTFVSGNLQAKDPEIIVRFIGGQKSYEVTFREASLDGLDPLYLATDQDVSDFRDQLMTQSAALTQSAQLSSDRANRIASQAQKILKLNLPPNKNFLITDHYKHIKYAATKKLEASELSSTEKNIQFFWAHLAEREKGEYKLTNLTRVERIVLYYLLPIAKTDITPPHVREYLNRDRANTLEILRGKLDSEKRVDSKLIEDFIKKQSTSRRSYTVNTWLEAGWPAKKIEGWIRDAVPVVEYVLSQEFPEAGINPRPLPPPGRSEARQEAETKTLEQRKMEAIRRLQTLQHRAFYSNGSDVPFKISEEATLHRKKLQNGFALLNESLLGEPLEALLFKAEKFLNANEAHLKVTGPSPDTPIRSEAREGIPDEAVEIAGTSYYYSVDKGAMSPEITLYRTNGTDKQILGEPLKLLRRDEMATAASAGVFVDPQGKVAIFGFKGADKKDHIKIISLDDPEKVLDLAGRGSLPLDPKNIVYYGEENAVTIRPTGGRVITVDLEDFRVSAVAEHKTVKSLDLLQAANVGTSHLGPEGTRGGTETIEKDKKLGKDVVVLHDYWVSLPTSGVGIFYEMKNGPVKLGKGGLTHLRLRYKSDTPLYLEFKTKANEKEKKPEKTFMYKKGKPTPFPPTDGDWKEVFIEFEGDMVNEGASFQADTISIGAKAKGKAASLDIQLLELKPLKPAPPKVKEKPEKAVGGAGLFRGRQPAFVKAAEILLVGYSLTQFSWSDGLSAAGTSGPSAILLLAPVALFHLAAVAASFFPARELRETPRSEMRTVVKNWDELSVVIARVEKETGGIQEVELPEGLDLDLKNGQIIIAGRLPVFFGRPADYGSLSEYLLAVLQSEILQGTLDLRPPFEITLQQYPVEGELWKVRNVLQIVKIDEKNELEPQVETAIKALQKKWFLTWTGDYREKKASVVYALRVLGIDALKDAQFFKPTLYELTLRALALKNLGFDFEARVGEYKVEAGQPKQTIILIPRRAEVRALGGYPTVAKASGALISYLAGKMHQAKTGDKYNQYLQDAEKARQAKENNDEEAIEELFETYPNAQARAEARGMESGMIRELILQNHPELKAHASLQLKVVPHPNVEKWPGAFQILVTAPADETGLNPEMKTVINSVRNEIEGKTQEMGLDNPWAGYEALTVEARRTEKLLVQGFILKKVSLPPPFVVAPPLPKVIPAPAGIFISKKMLWAIGAAFLGMVLLGAIFIPMIFRAPVPAEQIVQKQEMVQPRAERGPPAEEKSQETLPRQETPPPPTVPQPSQPPQEEKKVKMTPNLLARTRWNEYVGSALDKDRENPEIKIQNITDYRLGMISGVDEGSDVDLNQYEAVLVIYKDDDEDDKPAAISLEFKRETIQVIENRLWVDLPDTGGEQKTIWVAIPKNRLTKDARAPLFGLIFPSGNATLLDIRLVEKNLDPNLQKMGEAPEKKPEPEVKPMPPVKEPEKPAVEPEAKRVEIPKMNPVLNNALLRQLYLDTYRGLFVLRSPSNGMPYNQTKGPSVPNAGWIKSGDVGFLWTSDIIAAANHAQVPVGKDSAPAAVTERIRKSLKLYAQMVNDFGLRVGGRQTGILPEVLVHRGSYFTTEEHDVPGGRQGEKGIIYASYDMGLTTQRLMLLAEIFEGGIVPGLGDREIAGLADQLLNETSYHPFVDGEGKLHRQVSVTRDKRIVLAPGLIDNKHTEAKLFLPIIQAGMLGDPASDLAERIRQGDAIWDEMFFNWIQFHAGKEIFPLAQGDGSLSTWTEFYGNLFYEEAGLAPRSEGVSHTSYVDAGIAVGKEERHKIYYTAPGTGKDPDEYYPFGLEDNQVTVPAGPLLASTTGRPETIKNVEELIKLARGTRSYANNWGLPDALDPATGRAFNGKIIYENQGIILEALNHPILRTGAQNQSEYPGVVREYKELDEKHPAPAREEAPQEAAGQKPVNLIERFDQVGHFSQKDRAPGNEVAKEENHIAIKYQLGPGNEFAGFYGKFDAGKELNPENYQTLEIVLGEKGKFPDRFKIELKDNAGGIVWVKETDKPLQGGQTLRFDTSRARRPISKITIVFEKAKAGRNQSGEFTIKSFSLISKSRSEVRADEFSELLTAGIIAVPVILMAAHMSLREGVAGAHKDIMQRARKAIQSKPGSLHFIKFYFILAIGRKYHYGFSALTADSPEAGAYQAAQRAFTAFLNSIKDSKRWNRSKLWMVSKIAADHPFRKQAVEFLRVFALDSGKPPHVTQYAEKLYSSISRSEARTEMLKLIEANLEKARKGIDFLQELMGYENPQKFREALVRGGYETDGQFAALVAETRDSLDNAKKLMTDLETLISMIKPYNSDKTNKLEPPLKLLREREKALSESFNNLAEEIDDRIGVSVPVLAPSLASRAEVRTKKATLIALSVAGALITGGVGYFIFRQMAPQKVPADQKPAVVLPAEDEKIEPVMTYEDIDEHINRTPRDSRPGIVFILTPKRKGVKGEEDWEFSIRVKKTGFEERFTNVTGFISDKEGNLWIRALDEYNPEDPYRPEYYLITADSRATRIVRNMEVVPPDVKEALSKVPRNGKAQPPRQPMAPKVDAFTNATVLHEMPLPDLEENISGENLLKKVSLALLNDYPGHELWIAGMLEKDTFVVVLDTKIREQGRNLTKHSFRVFVGRRSGEGFVQELEITDFSQDRGGGIYLNAGTGPFQRGTDTLEIRFGKILKNQEKILPSIHDLEGKISDRERIDLKIQEKAYPSHNLKETEQSLGKAVAKKEFVLLYLYNHGEKRAEAIITTVTSIKPDNLFGGLDIEFGPEVLQLEDEQEQETLRKFFDSTAKGEETQKMRDSLIEPDGSYRFYKGPLRGIQVQEESSDLKTYSVRAIFPVTKAPRAEVRTESESVGKSVLETRLQEFEVELRERLKPTVEAVHGAIREIPSLEAVLILRALIEHARDLQEPQLPMLSFDVRRHFNEALNRAFSEIWLRSGEQETEPVKLMRAVSGDYTTGKLRLSRLLAYTDSTPVIEERIAELENKLREDLKPAVEVVHKAIREIPSLDLLLSAIDLVQTGEYVPERHGELYSYLEKAVPYKYFRHPSLVKTANSLVQLLIYTDAAKARAEVRTKNVEASYFTDLENQWGTDWSEDSVKRHVQELRKQIAVYLYPLRLNPITSMRTIRVLMLPVEGEALLEMLRRVSKADLEILEKLNEMQKNEDFVRSRKELLTKHDEFIKHSLLNKPQNFQSLSAEQLLSLILSREWLGTTGMEKELFSFFNALREQGEAAGLLRNLLEIRQKALGLTHWDLWHRAQKNTSVEVFHATNEEIGEKGQIVVKGELYGALVPRFSTIFGYGPYVYHLKVPITSITGSYFIFDYPDSDLSIGDEFGHQSEVFIGAGVFPILGIYRTDDTSDKGWAQFLRGYDIQLTLPDESRAAPIMAQISGLEMPGFQRQEEVATVDIEPILTQMHFDSSKNTYRSFVQKISQPGYDLHSLTASVLFWKLVELFLKTTDEMRGHAVDMLARLVVTLKERGVYYGKIFDYSSFDRINDQVHIASQLIESALNPNEDTKTIDSLYTVLGFGFIRTLDFHLEKSLINFLKEPLPTNADRLIRKLELVGIYIKNVYEIDNIEPITNLLAQEGNVPQEVKEKAKSVLQLNEERRNITNQTAIKLYAKSLTGTPSPGGDYEINSRAEVRLDENFDVQFKEEGANTVVQLGKHEFVLASEDLDQLRINLRNIDVKKRDANLPSIPPESQGDLFKNYLLSVITLFLPSLDHLKEKQIPLMEFISPLEIKYQEDYITITYRNLLLKVRFSDGFIRYETSAGEILDLPYGSVEKKSMDRVTYLLIFFPAILHPNYQNEALRLFDYVQRQKTNEAFNEALLQLQDIYRRAEARTGIGEILSGAGRFGEYASLGLSAVHAGFLFWQWFHLFAMQKKDPAKAREEALGIFEKLNIDRTTSDPEHKTTNKTLDDIEALIVSSVLGQLTKEQEEAIRKHFDYLTQRYEEQIEGMKQIQAILDQFPTLAKDKGMDRELRAASKLAEHDRIALERMNDKKMLLEDLKKKKGEGFAQLAALALLKVKQPLPENFKKEWEKTFKASKSVEDAVKKSQGAGTEKPAEEKIDPKEISEKLKEYDILKELNFAPKNGLKLVQNETGVTLQPATGQGQYAEAVVPSKIIIHLEEKPNMVLTFVVSPKASVNSEIKDRVTRKRLIGQNEKPRIALDLPDRKGRQDFIVRNLREFDIAKDQKEKIVGVITFGSPQGGQIQILQIAFLSDEELKAVGLPVPRSEARTSEERKDDVLFYQNESGKDWRSREGEISLPQAWGAPAWLNLTPHEMHSIRLYLDSERLIDADPKMIGVVHDPQVPFEGTFQKEQVFILLNHLYLLQPTLRRFRGIDEKETFLDFALEQRFKRFGISHNDVWAEVLRGLFERILAQGPLQVWGVETIAGKGDYVPLSYLGKVRFSMGFLPEEGMRLLVQKIAKNRKTSLGYEVKIQPIPGYLDVSWRTKPKEGKYEAYEIDRLYNADRGRTLLSVIRWALNAGPKNYPWQEVSFDISRSEFSIQLMKRTPERNLSLRGLLRVPFIRSETRAGTMQSLKERGYAGANYKNRETVQNYGLEQTVAMMQAGDYIFKNLVRPDMKILDLGAGTGFITELAVRNNVREVVALDVAGPMLERAKAKIENARAQVEERTGTRPNTNVRFVEGDLFEFDALLEKEGQGRETFDAIILANVLSLYRGEAGKNSIRNLLSTFQNHLAPNGLVVILDRTADSTSLNLPSHFIETAEKWKNTMARYRPMFEELGYINFTQKEVSWEEDTDDDFGGDMNQTTSANIVITARRPGPAPETGATGRAETRPAPVLTPRDTVDQFVVQATNVVNLPQGQILSGEIPKTRPAAVSAPIAAALPGFTLPAPLTEPPVFGSLQDLASSRPYAARAEVHEIIRAISEVSTRVFINAGGSPNPIWSFEDTAGRAELRSVFLEVSRTAVLENLTPENLMAFKMEKVFPANDRQAVQMQKLKGEHAGLVMVTDHVPSAAELRANVLPAVLPGSEIHVELIIAAPKESLDTASLEARRSEIGLWIPGVVKTKKVEIIVPNNLMDLKEILEGAGSRMYRKMLGKGVPLSQKAFARDRVLVDIQGGVWEKLVNELPDLAGVLLPYQAVFYRSSLEPNTLAAGKFYEGLLVTKKLSPFDTRDHFSRRTGTASRHYDVNEGSLSPFASITEALKILEKLATFA